MSFFGKQSPTNLGDDSDLQNPQYELRAEQEKRAWIEEGFQVLLPSQEYNEYSGFIYSHKVDWMRSSLEDIKSELKKSFVGVEKISGQAIAKVAGERDQKLMLQLRHEMRDIADKILKK